MRRDSVYGRRIIWSGRPRVLAAPLSFRLGALGMALLASVATSFAIVVASALQAPVGSLLFFAAWCATIALVLGHGPGIWRQRVEYLVTEDQVVYQRGSFRRAIERHGISYARIEWHPNLPGTGDLKLIRAVPTGALRRRLTLTLPGLEAPDAVWALIRGAPPPQPGQDGALLMSQRLEEGERVLWSARPRKSWRHLLPSESRDLGNLALALLVFAVLVRQVMVAVPVTKQVLAAGIPVQSLSFIALMAAFGLASLLLAGVSFGLGYVALLRPARRFRETRYFITNRRVLIQRGREELSLDRSRIVDVIESPRGRDHDLFLVLDGPRARALATSGAFGKSRRKDSLLPVLRAISDPEAVSRVLREPPSEAREAVAAE